MGVAREAEHYPQGTSGVGAEGSGSDLYVRDEPESLRQILKEGEELLAAGVKVKAVTRLHAKLYWSESEAVLTSANLLDSSFDKSIEFGLAVPVGDLHAEVRTFIGGLVAAKEFPRAASSARSSQATKKSASEGFCIRCAAAIPLATSRPYCREDYEVWAEYENRDYEESFCHACGDETASTMDKPLCTSCFRRKAA